MRNSILIALAMGAALTTGAVAGDLGRDRSLKDRPIERSEPTAHESPAINWTGFYVGGQLGVGNSNHNLSIDEMKRTPASCAGGAVTPAGDGCVGGIGVFTPAKDVSVANAFIDGINSNGIFGGGTIGGDAQLGNIVIGLFGDYNFTQAETEAGIRLSVCPKCLKGGAGIEEGEAWLVALRAGYLFGEEKRTLLYILGGYGQQEMTYSVGDDSVDATFSGLVAGAGAEHALTKNIFLSLEYQHFFGGEETLIDDRNAAGNGAVLKDELDTDKVMLKLKAKLGTGSVGELLY